MSSSAVARVFALAFLVAIAAVIYAFMQQSEVGAAQMKVAEVEKELATWKTRANQYAEQRKTDVAALDSCNAKVTEIQTALDEASKRAPARAKR